jgi:putative ABC transport system permease protein
LGLGGALALTGILRHLLFHVSATDPAVFWGIGLSFPFVALIASCFPAWRAARVDPMLALQGE